MLSTRNISMSTRNRSEDDYLVLAYSRILSEGLYTVSSVHPVAIRMEVFGRLEYQGKWFRRPTFELGKVDLSMWKPGHHLGL